MKSNVEVIHFYIKTRGVQGHGFVQITFENCTLNFYFENSEIGIKLPNCSQIFCMFTHFYVALFFKKKCFMKLATFFISSTKRIFTKLLSVSESSVKVKVGSHWAHFLILLTSAVICKQQIYMEMRLCNIFKTANSITLNKTISESLCEELQGLWKRPVQFPKNVQF